MDSTTIQHNKLMHLENTMVMYGIYNGETLEKLINTVHGIHNFTSSNQKLFVGQQGMALLQPIYANMQGIQHYSINSPTVPKNCERKCFDVQRVYNAIAHIWDCY